MFDKKIHIIYFAELTISNHKNKIFEKKKTKNLSPSSDRVLGLVLLNLNQLSISVLNGLFFSHL